MRVPMEYYDYYNQSPWTDWFGTIEGYIPGSPSISTEISEAETQSTADQPMYNLEGQRVGKDYKGIVIQNGKKVMIK